MSEKQIFKTEFVNRRTDQSAQIMFANSPSGLFVPPHSTFELESEDPLDMYARFSKVQFLRNGDIKLSQRAGWAELEKTLNYGSPWVVKFWNRDGSTWESIYLGGEHNRPVMIPKGIPRYLPVSLDSIYVRYTEFIWEFQLRKEKIENSSYFTETWGLQRYGIERPKEELKKIGELIKKRDIENAKKIAEKNVNAYVKQRGLV